MMKEYTAMFLCCDSATARVGVVNETEKSDQFNQCVSNVKHVFNHDTVLLLPNLHCLSNVITAF